MVQLGTRCERRNMNIKIYNRVTIMNTGLQCINLQGYRFISLQSYNFTILQFPNFTNGTNLQHNLDIHRKKLKLRTIVEGKKA